MKSIFIHLVSFDRQRGERQGSIVGLIASSLITNIDAYHTHEKKKMYENLQQNMTLVSHDINNPKEWHVWRFEWKIKDPSQYSNLLQMGVISMRSAKIFFEETKHFDIPDLKHVPNNYPQSNGKEKLHFKNTDDEEDNHYNTANSR